MGDLTNKYGDFRINPKGRSIDMCGKNLINVGEIQSAPEFYTLNIAKRVIDPSNTDETVAAIVDLVPGTTYGLTIDLVMTTTTAPAYVTEKMCATAGQQTTQTTQYFSLEITDNEAAIIMAPEVTSFIGTVKIIEL
jgi:hypothetical protein